MAGRYATAGGSPSKDNGKGPKRSSPSKRLSQPPTQLTTPYRERHPRAAKIAHVNVFKDDDWEQEYDSEEEDVEETPRASRGMQGLDRHPALSSDASSEAASKRSSSPTKIAELGGLQGGLEYEVLTSFEGIKTGHALYEVRWLLEKIQDYTEGVGVLPIAMKVSHSLGSSSVRVPVAKAHMRRSRVCGNSRCKGCNGSDLQLTVTAPFPCLPLAPHKLGGCLLICTDKPSLQLDPQYKRDFRLDHIFDRTAQRDKNGTVPDLATVVKLCAKTNDCSRVQEVEACWNCFVHAPIANLALDLSIYKEQLRVANMYGEAQSHACTFTNIYSTTARISPPSLKPIRESGEKLKGKIVDFAIVLRPNNKTTAAFSNLEALPGAGTPSFNQTCQPTVIKMPIVINIETKAEGGKLLFHHACL